MAFLTFLKVPGVVHISPAAFSGTMVIEESVKAQPSAYAQSG